jgi:hypothetical protein
MKRDLAAVNVKIAFFAGRKEKLAGFYGSGIKKQFF